jgi:hypothetical protein
VRLPFSAIPAEGEIVGSVVTRNVERSGIPQGQLLQALTGQKGIRSMLATLPGYLRTLTTTLPLGHPLTDINVAIRAHSAFQYFTYFDTPEKRKVAFQLLAEEDFSQRVALALGLAKYKCEPSPRSPRFCPECVQVDKRACGFAFFHREHQLPGVGVCWLHGSILAHGCSKCGAYPIFRLGLSTPGKCLCSQISPLPAFDYLPMSLPALHWIARESAHIVASEGTQIHSVREYLRSKAIRSGFGNGRCPSNVKLAGAIESRFGLDLLNWLGYPALTLGAPSGWIGKSLYPKQENRSPTLVFLLFVGIFADSVKGFEAEAEEFQNLSGVCVHDISAIERPASRRAPVRESSVPEWKTRLHEVLIAVDFNLNSASKRLHVSLCQIAHEALAQGIRVPLTHQRASKRLATVLPQVHADLRDGMPQAQVLAKHHIGGWMLIRIMLDCPGLYEANRSAAAPWFVNMHRQKILALMASRNDVSRSSVREVLPGSYYSLLQADKDWFHAHVPRRARPPNSRRHKTDFPALDGKLALLAEGAVDKILSAKRPRQVTRSGILRCIRAMNKFGQYRQMLPLTESVLSTHAESRIQFMERKIRWAVQEMSGAGVAISVNLLRRKVGLGARLLRGYRPLILRIVQDMGALIHQQSFFA